jgi:hypothetical protein
MACSGTTLLFFSQTGSILFISQTGSKEVSVYLWNTAKLSTVPTSLFSSLAYIQGIAIGEQQAEKN